MLGDAGFERVADAFGAIDEESCGGRWTKVLHRVAEEREPQIEMLARKTGMRACAGMGRP